MKADERLRRERAHHEHERLTFGFKPWEYFAYMATGPAPAADATSPYALSWPRARAIRDELLAANPDHYRDIGG